jgi:hypothetical protein
MKWWHGVELAPIQKHMSQASQGDSKAGGQMELASAMFGFGTLAALILLERPRLPLRWYNLSMILTNVALLLATCGDVLLTINIAAVSTELGLFGLVLVTIAAFVLLSLAALRWSARPRRGRR